MTREACSSGADLPRFDCYALKRLFENFKCRLHLVLNAFGAKVSYGAFMSVVHGSVWMILSILDLHSSGAICLAEWHT